MPSITRTGAILKLLLAASVISLMLMFLVGLAWAFQERIAFQPPRGPWPAPSGVTRVDYLASDGQPLFAYIVGDRAVNRGILLSFHGNADLSVWQIDWATEVARRTELTVMLAEYRGYMGLKGRPTYATSQLDAEAAHRFASETLSVPAAELALFGHSLGTAVATELAAKLPPATLILQSPFTSARDMAARMTGYRASNFLWNLVSRLHFDTEARVATMDAPVSVAHGERDRLIPVRMGERVFSAARNKGSWLLVPGATHNDVAVMGGEAYWAWLTEALAPVTALSAAQRSRE